MGAAEHQGVDALGDQGLDHRAHEGAGVGRIDVAFFDLVGPAHALCRDELDIGRKRLDAPEQLGVAFAGQGARGGQHAHFARHGFHGGRLEARLDADDGDAVLGAQGLHCGGGGGIAGHDDGLDALVDHPAADAEAAFEDEFVGFFAVRRVARIGEIDQVFVGQIAMDRMQDRQTAQARIEDADRGERERAGFRGFDGMRVVGLRVFAVDHAFICREFGIGGHAHARPDSSVHVRRRSWRALRS